MKHPTVNQIVLFQFQKKDKHRIYNAKRIVPIDITMRTQDQYIVGIYIPPKKLQDGNVYLDINLIKNYIDFVSLLKKRDIHTFIVVYDRTHLFELNNILFTQTTKK